jgi:hypothetical protein
VLVTGSAQLGMIVPRNDIHAGAFKSGHYAVIEMEGITVKEILLKSV